MPNKWITRSSTTQDEALLYKDGKCRRPFFVEFRMGDTQLSWSCAHGTMHGTPMIYIERTNWAYKAFRETSTPSTKSTFINAHTNTLILKFHWEIGSWCVSYLFVQFSGFGVVGFLHEISQLVTLEVESFKFRRWALESPAPDRFSPRKSAGDAQVLTTCEPWWTTFRKAFSIRQANSSTAICIWAFEHQISVQVGRFGRIWCWTSGTVGLWVLKSDGIAVIQLISRNSTPDIPDSLVITLNPL